MLAEVATRLLQWRNRFRNAGIIAGPFVCGGCLVLYHLYVQPTSSTDADGSDLLDLLSVISLVFGIVLGLLAGVLIWAVGHVIWPPNDDVEPEISFEIFD
jgi:hypothetical protein